MRGAVATLAGVWLVWSLAAWVADTYRTLGVVAALLALLACVIAIQIGGKFRGL